MTKAGPKRNAWLQPFLLGNKNGKHKGGKHSNEELKRNNRADNTSSQEMMQITAYIRETGNNNIRMI